MAETPQNIEISQETINALLNNPQFLDAVAKKLGTSKPQTGGGWVNAESASGGAFPQMDKDQLYNFAKSINRNVNQQTAAIQYEQIAR